MKPKPAKPTDAVEYPSFCKFHAARCLAAGTAVVVAISGCKPTPGKMALPEMPLPETVRTNSVEECLSPGLPPISVAAPNFLSIESKDPRIMGAIPPEFDQ